MFTGDDARTMVSLDAAQQFTPHEARTTSALAARAMRWIVPIALYGLALLTLLAPVVNHPNQPYNWEPYTAEGAFRFSDNPSWSIFSATGGLMTDSGDVPITVLPAWVGFRIAGVSLDAMRVPIALVAALAPVLLWFTGRRLTSGPVALLAAALMAVSPAFIVYGRTATNVGISLVPALLTIYALARVLERPADWRWLAALQLTLALGLYTYAPGRFLWLIALVLLVLEVALRPLEWRALAIAFGVTLLVLPLTLSLIMREPVPLALDHYYAGRGEHLLAMSANPDRFEHYVELTAEERATGVAEREPARMALRLIWRNTRHLVSLLAEWDTRPAVMDYWNAHGRLYALPLVPFAAIGLLTCLYRALGSWKSRLILALFFGFTVPLLLTSQVHIGRLIFVLPVLFLLIALGVETVVTVAARRFELTPVRSLALFAGAAALLFGASATLTWREYQDPIPPTWQSAAVAELRAELPVLAEGKSAALLLDRSEQLEVIDIAEFRLALDDELRFVDVRETAPSVSDNRPSVYYGQLYNHIETQDDIPGKCDNVYFVSLDLMPDFVEHAPAFWSECATPLRFLALPY